MNELQKYRKYQNGLMVAGRCVILFSAWSIVKLFLSLTVDRSHTKLLIKDMIDDVIDYDQVDLELLELIIMSLMAFFLLVEIVIRLIVGTAAKRAAKGGRLGIIPVGLVFIHLLSSLESLRSSFLILPDTRMVEQCSETFMDVASIVLDVIILFTAYKVAKHRKAERTAHAD